MSGRLKSVSAKRMQAVGAFGKIWKTMLATGASAAALAAINANIRRNAKEPEENALGGEPLWFEWREGNVFYKEAGREHAGGPPLVFVHGIGAGSSSFMWRKNFDALSESFHVYALDLLGFGSSDKPATAPYSADLYTELIVDFIRDVARAPAAIIANSLAAAFTIRVADEHPDLVRSLVLIAPTGADSLRNRPGMTGAAFYGLLQSPVLGTSFYNVMSSERSIRDYARRQMFYEPSRVTNRLVTQLYAASHQEGAQHAISAFLSGFLNTDIRDAFARLQQPVTLVWGKQDKTTPIEQAAALLSLNPRADMEIFDRCRMTPHEEHPEKFNALVARALGSRSAAA